MRHASYIHRLLPLIAFLAMAQAALGQFTAPVPGTAAQPSKRVQAQLVLYEGQAVPGEMAMLGILLDVQENWKIQAGKGSGDEMEFTLPTEVKLTLPDGWVAGDVLWPKSRAFTVGEGEFAIQSRVYEHRTLFAVPIHVPQDAEAGEQEIVATIRYQACDPIKCDMPTNVAVSTFIQVAESREGEPGPGAHLEEEVATLFADLLALHAAAPAGGGPPLVAPPRTDADATGEPADEAGAADASAAPTFARPTFFGYTLPQFDGWLGLFILALFAALGGFILNLTPCVLPVIPIKIMTILQHANHPGRNLVLGLWMFFGVVAFWVAIGLPVAFVSVTGVTDPSIMFGIWWLTLGIGVVIAVMGLGIMGMFSIQLPGAVYAINPKADTAWGSFVFGIMTGVLGLPCFGFVAGALLVGVATMPVSHIMTIFTALGLGMALPYLVLSLKPSLVERIPRTGPASELVKQVMGLLLMAAAAFFIGSGLIALVRTEPYVATQLHWWAVAFFAVLAGVWLIVRVFQISKQPLPRVAFSFVGLILGGAAVLYAASATTKAKDDYDSRQASLGAQGGGAYVTGSWNPYTPAAFEQARADEKVVVLDFTAEWCLNCKFLKASVLDRDPVRSALNDDEVVKFTVDLTSTSDPGWKFLHELGQTGIPLLVIFTPGSDEPWQANAYTPQQVLTALDDARSNRIAQR